MKMCSNLPSVGKDITCPQSDKPRRDLTQNVDRCGEELTVLRQREALVGERREGREAAEHADQEKRVLLWRQHEPLLGGPDDRTKHHTADKVDGECADGKQRAR